MCADLPPSTYFNSSGRATPDVSALGVNFVIVQDGVTQVVDGTSCSYDIPLAFLLDVSGRENHLTALQGSHVRRHRGSAESGPLPARKVLSRLPQSGNASLIPLHRPHVSCLLYSPVVVLLLIERQWLYAAAEKDPNAFFDVTEGQNKFGCCHAGFPAAPGWVQPLPEQREPGKKKKRDNCAFLIFIQDAVTGLGTPNYELLKTLV